MSGFVPDPGRFVGMHFFNPPQVMKLVEIIPAATTRPETVATVKETAERLGKTTVTIKRDSPGFVVNRILITYLNEAANLLEKGYTKEQIDAAMQYSAGMPMGPFMLADLIGLDITYNILRVFEDGLGPSYKPAKAIRSLFDAKKLGRKTGEGFYVYGKPAVTEEQGKGFDTNLLLKPFIVEAEKLVTEGVADPGPIDTAVKLGINSPYGPFELKAKLESGVGPVERPVLTETKDGIVRITLNRPAKLNSISLAMLLSVADAVGKADADPSVRCILITGAGDRAFAAGADVDELGGFNPTQALEYSRTAHKAMAGIKAVKKPVVAAINGFALGGGLELASWCDMRVASDKAKLGQPEANLGLIPGWGGTKILGLLVGTQRAKSMIASGDQITAEEARVIGLVDRVFPAAEYDVKVAEFVSKLASSSPSVIASVKKLTNPTPTPDQLEEEAQVFSAIFATRDMKEGIAAFRERRKPVFTGQ